MVRSIDPRRETLPQSSGNLGNRLTVGNSCRETHLGSGHVRPHQQTGHMIASDPIRALHHLLRAGGRPHMDCPVKPGNDTDRVDRVNSYVKRANLTPMGAPLLVARSVQDAKIPSDWLKRAMA